MMNHREGSVLLTNLEGVNMFGFKRRKTAEVPWSQLVHVKVIEPDIPSFVEQAKRDNDSEVSL